VVIKLNLPKNEAADVVTEFFRDRNLLVQQTGIQGVIYKIGSYTQTGSISLLMYRTVSMAKLAGAQGYALITVQPALVVALPTIRAIFFHGCGALMGNNTVGRTCTTIGNFLNLPMDLTENLFNAYVSPVILKVTGIPTILNYTNQMNQGFGLNPDEVMKLLADKDKGLVSKLLDKKTDVTKTVKEWIIKQLSKS
jgi:hypothetical protein